MYWVAGVSGNEIERGPKEGYGNIPTIFDRLEERGISWKFYVENYDPTINFRSVVPEEGLGNRASQIVWVPLLNFDRFLDDPNLSSHIVDLSEYFDDLENGTLPAVAYMVPSGASEHPPGSIRSGERFVKTLIQALMRSSVWSSSIFMWTYDDWGGWYDHVPPPEVDKYGYGFRVPALLVSAYARRGYVDSTELDFTSVLKFIEENWDLEPLAERDARANSIVTALDFSQPARQPFLIPFSREPDKVPSEPKRGVIYAAYGAAVVCAGFMFTLAARVDRKYAGRRAIPRKSGMRGKVSKSRNGSRAI
jgi:phospholipase C